MESVIKNEVQDGKNDVCNQNKLVFEDIKSNLPKTWEEFCNQAKVYGEYYIDLDSSIKENDDDYYRDPIYDRGILPSKEAARQHLVLMQLHQLRDCYRQGWKPDWKDWNSIKICIIHTHENKYEIEPRFDYDPQFLSFQNSKVAKEFLKNFRYLIKQAGDLI